MNKKNKPLISINSSNAWVFIIIASILLLFALKTFFPEEFQIGLQTEINKAFDFIVIILGG
jgi:hypothetical protein